MMADLLIGVGCIGMGVTGLVFLPHIRRLISRVALSEADRIRIKLRKLTAIELRTEYHHACAAALVCAGKNDRRGMRNARRYSRLIIEEARERAKRRAFDVLH